MLVSNNHHCPSTTTIGGAPRALARSPASAASSTRPPPPNRAPNHESFPASVSPCFRPGAGANSPPLPTTINTNAAAAAMAPGRCLDIAGRRRWSTQHTRHGNDERADHKHGSRRCWSGGEKSSSADTPRPRVAHGSFNPKFREEDPREHLPTSNPPSTSRSPLTFV
jgi:hypothetical protein